MKTRAIALGAFLACASAVVYADGQVQKKLPWEMTWNELSAAAGNTNQAPQPAKEPTVSNITFSLRCAGEPRVIGTGTMQSKFTDFMYLRWDGQQLMHKGYSTPVDSPERWYPDENMSIFTSSTAGGKATVSAVESHRTKDYHNIEVQLKYTDETGLDALVGEGISDGTWEINVDQNGNTTVNETTASYSGNKLTASSQSRWTHCRLMTSSGQDMLF